MNQIGPYRLLERLGAGGMGVAYKACDAGGRVVVVKVLRPEVAEDPSGRQRLAREVDTMRRVRSPYVARVFDADLDGARPYLVTQYVRGPSLRDHVDRTGPLREEALLRLASGLTEAVWAIHRAGIVHRDLTPGNVLLVDGEPMVIDFGIAWAIDATRLTVTGTVVGTPGYLAVELLDGARAGPPVDIFALGATLAFAAGGRPPFGSGPMQAIHYRIVTGKVDLRTVPAVLTEPLRAALSPDPDKRPTIQQLRDQIRGFDPATLAGPIGPAGSSEPAEPPGPAGPMGSAESATAGSPDEEQTQRIDPSERASDAADAAADGGMASRVDAVPVTWENLAVAAIPVLVLTAALVFSPMPSWIWVPWGIAGGSAFTWLRTNYRGPTDVRSLVNRIALEGVLAVGCGSAVAWAVTLLFWIVAVGV